MGNKITIDIGTHDSDSYWESMLSNLSRLYDRAKTGNRLTTQHDLDLMIFCLEFIGKLQAQDPNKSGRATDSIPNPFANWEQSFLACGSDVPNASGENMNKKDFIKAHNLLKQYVGVKASNGHIVRDVTWMPRNPEDYDQHFEWYGRSIRGENQPASFERKEYVDVQPMIVTEFNGAFVCWTMPDFEKANPNSLIFRFREVLSGINGINELWL